MFKYTKTTLKKLEDILATQDYKVRYEKGNFNSGYCIVENKKMAVVNRFFDTEGRINTLLEIVANTEIDESLLDEKQIKFLKTTRKAAIEAPKEESE